MTTDSQKQFTIMDQLTQTTLFRCTRCGTARDSSWFYKDRRRRRSWRTPWCKPCLREASRLRRTGMTQQAYDALMADQDGRCAICRTAFDNDCVARIDRGVGGVVRGLLCGRCKIGISTFRDDVDRMRAAARYLVA